MSNFKYCRNKDSTATKNESYKEEPSGNLELQKYNNQNKILNDRLNSRMEETSGESVNWKIEQ